MERFFYHVISTNACLRWKTTIRVHMFFGKLIIAWVLLMF